MYSNTNDSFLMSNESYRKAKMRYKKNIKLRINSLVLIHHIKNLNTLVIYNLDLHV
jgi:hypothetical protein